MTKAKKSSASTAKIVNHGDARIDALKEQLRSTPQEVDYDRMTIIVMTSGSRFGTVITAINTAAKLRVPIPSAMTLR